MGLGEVGALPALAGQEQNLPLGGQFHQVIQGGGQYMVVIASNGEAL